jgi:hypothetical protein
MLITSASIFFNFDSCFDPGAYSIAASIRWGSATVRVVGIWVRIPLEECLFLALVMCCQITLRRVDHSYRGVLTRVVCLNACDCEASIIRKSWPTKSCYAMEKEVRLGSSGRNLWLNRTQLSAREVTIKRSVVKWCIDIPENARNYNVL